MSFEPLYWHWLALACVFLVIEITAPIAFFLWLSLAAGTTAIITFIAPDLSWQFQGALFSVLCVLSLVAWKKLAREGNVRETDQPTLNQRNQRYVGRTLELIEAIENGIGKVRVEDSQWKVAGKDAKVGSQVRVVAVEGSILQVELCDPS